MSARDPQALFDHRQVRRAFSRAAPGYDAAAALQRAVEAQLLESLDYYRLQHEDAVPARVVDVGSGLGRGAAAMRKRWPKAQVLALDVALPMLREGRQREGWHPLRRGIDRMSLSRFAGWGAVSGLLLSGIFVVGSLVSGAAVGGAILPLLLVPTAASAACAAGTLALARRAERRELPGPRGSDGR